MNYFITHLLNGDASLRIENKTLPKRAVSMVCSFLEPLLIESWPEIKVKQRAWKALSLSNSTTWIEELWGFFTMSYDSFDDKCFMGAEAFRSSGTNMRALACGRAIKFSVQYGLEPTTPSPDPS